MTDRCAGLSAIYAGGNDRSAGMTDSELLKDGERIDDLQCNGFRII